LLEGSINTIKNAVKYEETDKKEEDDDEDNDISMDASDNIE
jgi:hypothetical protein